MLSIRLTGRRPVTVLANGDRRFAVAQRPAGLRSPVPSETRERRVASDGGGVSATHPTEYMAHAQQAHLTVWNVGIEKCDG